MSPRKLGMLTKVSSMALSAVAAVVLFPGLQSVSSPRGEDETQVGGRAFTAESAGTTAAPGSAASSVNAIPHGGDDPFTPDSGGIPASPGTSVGPAVPADRRAPAPGRNGGGRKGGSGPTPNGDFEIKGTVAGLLYPSVTRALTITLENPHNFAIVITDAAVVVDDAGDCSGNVLRINNASTATAALPTGQTVPANGEATYDVPVVLANSAGDECRNATFPLRYSARAVKA